MSYNSIIKRQLFFLWARIWTCGSKRKTSLANKHMKMFQHLLLSEKSKLKSPWVTTPHPPEWLKFKTANKYLMLVRMWTNWNSHPLLVESIMVQSLGEFLVTLNIDLPSDSSVLLLDVYPKKWKHIHKKDLYKNVQNIFIHDSLKLKIV